MYMQGFSREGRMKVLAYFWLSLSTDPRSKLNLLYLKTLMTASELKKANDMIQKHKEKELNNKFDENT